VWNQFDLERLGCMRLVKSVHILFLFSNIPSIIFHLFLQYPSVFGRLGVTDPLRRVLAFRSQDLE